MNLNKHVKMDYVQAAKLFAQWDELCRADGGKLWGVNLHTPFVFIDPQERKATANELDCEGIFTKRGDIYKGIFPEHLVVSNSATEFGGKRWGMMAWNTLALKPDGVMQTIVHEAFHCLQPTLFGKDKPSGSNSHINETDARISLLLEIAALRQAKQTSSDARLDAIRAALSARQKRRLAYDRAYSENWIEISEGTAVYTELMITRPGLNEVHKKVIEATANAKDNKSLEFFFGYVSGALYCFLLDALGANWKSSLRYTSDLGELLRKAAGITEIPHYDEIDFEPYGYSGLVEAERQKVEEHEKMLAEIIRNFTQRPVLRIHEKGQLSIMGMPIAVPGLGTVIRGYIEFFGGFGRMYVRNGDFLDGDDVCMVLADELTITGSNVTGKGWDMELAEGYEVRPDDGGFVLTLTSI